MRAGVRVLLAGDDPLSGRPPGQVQQAGQLGDPGPGPLGVVRVIGREPAGTWRTATITGVTQAAMHEVPRRLGQALSAFWNHEHDSYPTGTTELLR